MKKKKLPKLKNIKKYAQGGDVVASAADQEQIDAQNAKNNKLSASQYAAIGGSLAQGSTQLNNNFNNPNSTIRQKSESLDNTTVEVASAINPIVGGIIGGANAIGKPIRSNLEKVDNQGNLVNQKGAQAGAIIGGLLDPIKALETRASYKGGFTDFSGKGYTNALEKQAKVGLPSQQQLQDQDQANIAAQRVDSTGYYKHGGIKRPKFSSFGVPSGLYPNGGTKLSRQDSVKYEQWKSKLPKNLQYDGDYDLTGFYKENPNFVAGKDQHLTDKFKLPNHPTFSNESIYYNNQTSPKGGHWSNETYIPNDPLNKQYPNGGIIPAYNPTSQLDYDNRVRQYNDSLNSPTQPIQAINPYLSYDMPITKEGIQNVPYDAYNMPPDQLSKLKGHITPIHAMGGVQNPNAEVEKQEVMRTPDGGTQQVDGPSHENGGVPVNIPNGTQIYSDRLKMPGTKKTFAKLAEKYKTNKEDKVLEDDKATSQAKATAKFISELKQKQLDSLFQAQESLKQSKVKDYAKKLGVELPQQQTQQSSTYATGGIYKPDRGSLTSDEIREEKDYANTTPNNPNRFDPTDMIEPGVNTILQNVGNLAYLHDQGKRYDKVNYGSVRPTQLNDAAALRDADINAAKATNGLRDAVGGNAGAYLANLSQIQSNNTQDKSRIREQYDNANAGISNQALYANQGYKMQGMQDEAANKGQALTNYYKAVEGVGTNTSAAYRDYKAGQMDKQSLDIISKMYPNYQYDNRRRGWYHKSTGEKLILK